MRFADHENPEPSRDSTTEAYGRRKHVVRCTTLVGVSFGILWGISAVAGNWLHPLPLLPMESLPNIAAYYFVLSICAAGLMVLPRRVEAIVIWSLVPLIVPGMLVLLGLLHTASFRDEEAWFAWFTWLMPLLRVLHALMLVYLALLIALGSYGWIRYFTTCRRS